MASLPGVLPVDVLEALSKNEKDMDSKDVRSIMKIYAKKFSGDRISSLDKSVQRLRSKTLRLREQIEIQKERDEMIIRELKRMLAARDAMIVDLQNDNSELKQTLDEVVMETSKRYADLQQSANVKEDQLAQKLQEYMNREADVTQFLEKKDALLETIEGQKQEIQRLQNSTNAALEELEAKKDAEHDVLMKSNAKLRVENLRLQNEVHEFRGSKKKNRRKSRFGALKHKPKNSFGYQLKTRVDQAEPEVVTKSMAETFENLSPEKEPIEPKMKSKKSWNRSVMVRTPKKAYRGSTAHGSPGMASRRKGGAFPSLAAQRGNAGSHGKRSMTSPYGQSPMNARSPKATWSHNRSPTRMASPFNRAPSPNSFSLKSFIVMPKFATAKAASSLYAANMQ